MRIVVATDSFKGSLSSYQAGETIKRAFQLEMPEIDIEVIPMADGGEGTVDALLYSTDSKRVDLQVTGPTGKKIDTYYAVSKDGQLAVLEVANIVGYSMVGESERNPFHLTTLGVGECIRHVLDQGVREVIIGLGGSATNDGGIGMLQALGVTFLDEQDVPLAPYPTSLAQVRRVDWSNLDRRLMETRIRVASDVNNPLCGPNGATFTFGPQKGVRKEMLKKLDESLAKYARCLEEGRGRKCREIPGAGAAGGLGFGLLLLGAMMETGATLISQLVGLPEKLKHADWLITGEGRTDGQTLRGKLPFTLAKQAKEKGVPTILISGALAGDLEPMYELFQSVHSIANGPITLEECMLQAEALLFQKARNIARLLKRELV